MLLSIFYPHWSLSTTVLYSVMGFFGSVVILNVQKQNIQIPFYKNKNYICWLLFWTFIATFRCIEGGAGGNDAGAYYLYFLNSFDIHGYELTALELYDSNLGFRWYNRILRLISDNQMYFLFVTHGIMLAFVIKFLDYFRFRKMSIVPFFLVVFWYIRGFCTIRSNLATAILLLSLIFLVDKRYKQSIVLAIISFLFHKMMIVYALFIPFYWYSQHKKITFKQIIIAILLLSLSTTLLTTYIFGGNVFGSDFSEHYSNYSDASMEVGFFGNFWKIAFEQIILGVMLLLFQKRIIIAASKMSSLEFRKFQVIWYACLFDCLLIPICSAFGIWRGYEIFYIPRLVMWAILLKVLEPRSVKLQVLYTILCIGLFYGWFLQRTSAESFWKDTTLMPYVFNNPL
jgi:hypothetical protein